MSKTVNNFRNNITTRTRVAVNQISHIKFTYYKDRIINKEKDPVEWITPTPP